MLSVNVNDETIIVPPRKINFTDIAKEDEEKKGDEDTKKQDGKQKFTARQKMGLVMLATVEFSSYCSMSIMAPFYPRKAAEKGMSPTMAGFVFSFYALIIFISSPLVGKIIPRLGVKTLFIGGIFVSGVCNILFGTLNYVNDYYLFTTLSFLIRGTEALGAASSSTAGYVLVINIFPHNGGTVRGILETFVGLGMSAGPAIGGFLYAAGDFGLPFYVIGSITTCVAPLNFFLLPSTKDCQINTKTGSFKSLLKIPSVIVTCIIITLVSTTWGFLDPTLEPHLRQYNLGASHIGLLFLLLAGTYGIGSPIWGWVSDKLVNYWFLMSFGLFMTSISLLFLGPSPVLFFLKSSIWLDISALSAMGVFVSMAMMPTYQSILDGALQSGFPDDLGTHSLIAGLWSCVYSSGEILGPVVGGWLLQEWGFPIASTCIAITELLVAVFATIYFYVRMKKRTKVPTSSNEESPTTNKNKDICVNVNDSDISVYTINNSNGDIKN